MKTKITVSGNFTNNRLSETASIMKAMDLGIEAITFPMSFSYEIDREEGSEYVKKLNDYLLKNKDWPDELILVGLDSIDISYFD